MADEHDQLALYFAAQQISRGKLNPELIEATRSLSPDGALAMLKVLIKTDRYVGQETAIMSTARIIAQAGTTPEQVIRELALRQQSTYP